MDQIRDVETKDGQGECGGEPEQAREPRKGIGPAHATAPAYREDEGRKWLGNEDSFRPVHHRPRLSALRGKFDHAQKLRVQNSHVNPKSVAVGVAAHGVGLSPTGLLR